MTEPEELEDDLFADLYDADDVPTKADVSAHQDLQPEPTPAVPTESELEVPAVLPEVPVAQDEAMNHGVDNHASEATFGNVHEPQDTARDQPPPVEEPRPIGTKEDGKMFIGGLNWETTDDSLREYFNTFGEVSECTVMRDGASGRSRGFGFLTFKEPQSVNAVMAKEHFLDGKIIDPKRAIPRDEQERTSKIFVGGVSQEANEQIFKEYFAQYGRVIDATLMMDKDTGRPRGFGFVTFDSESAVENTLNGDLTILGKPIEVKKAQPRGDMTEGGGDSLGRGRGAGRGGRRGYDDRYDNHNMGGQAGGQGNAGGMAGMTPQMMAQYFTRMQQMLQMQQQLAMGGMGGMGGMAGMNPAMMQQMQAMQQMQQMKALQMAQQGGQQGQQGQQGLSTSSQQGRNSQSPMPAQNPTNAAAGANVQGMNPQMMQQMQQMQQMAMQQQSGGAAAGAVGGPAGRNDNAAYNAQEQMMFEQQKYESQARGGGGNNGNWDGMYDESLQSDMGGRGRGRGRGFGPDRHGTPQSAPPANAPTGPKNSGRPGFTFRGNRGNHRGYHPYAR